MIESIEQERRRLYADQREAFEEYRLFLETTLLPHDGIPAAAYLAQMEDLRTNLKRVEAARKLFEDVNPLPVHQYF
jgi:hypothetical protein